MPRRFSEEELRSCTCTRAQLANVEFAAECPLHGLDSPPSQASNRKLVHIAGECDGVVFSAEEARDRSFRCEFRSRGEDGSTTLLNRIHVPRLQLRPMQEIMKAIEAEEKACG